MLALKQIVGPLEALALCTHGFERAGQLGLLASVLDAQAEDGAQVPLRVPFDRRLALRAAPLLLVCLKPLLDAFGAKHVPAPQLHWTVLPSWIQGLKADCAILDGDRRVLVFHRHLNSSSQHVWTVHPIGANGCQQLGCLAQLLGGLEARKLLLVEHS